MHVDSANRHLSNRATASPGMLLAVLLSGILLTGCSDQPAASGQVEVRDPYVHPPVADRTTTAGYFELRNHSDNTVRITGASSPVAERIELHTHTHEDGMMRMRQVQEVRVEAGEAIAFEPGGHHLMLFGVQAMPENQVSLTLTLDGAPDLTLEFSVRPR